MRTSLVILCFFLWVMPALAKDMEKCGSQNCVDCHTMDVQEASAVLGQLVDRVHNVQYAEVPGFWVVEIEKDSQRLPIYIDFSKQYLVSGNVLRLSDMANLTQEYSARFNRVDVSKIPLDDALLLGSPAAGTKAIVFTDPECPFCIKMHASMQEAVARDPDIAFLIKLFPLRKIHPNAYAISKSIVCSGSMELLEKSFARQPVPPATCETSAVDETLALTAELGISSTPTLVLPDGRLMPGFKQADDLLRLLGSKTLQTKSQ